MTVIISAAELWEAIRALRGDPTRSALVELSNRLEAVVPGAHPLDAVEIRRLDETRIDPVTRQVAKLEPMTAPGTAVPW